MIEHVVMWKFAESAEGKTRAESVVDALLGGPESESLTTLFPSSYEYNSIRVEEGICYVNLSEEQLFALMYELLDVQPEQGVECIAEFNDVIKRIETNNADETVIARHKELNALLVPVKRLRKLASVSIVNGMLLTEYFNEGLYLHDAKELLWKLMCDPILEVRNDACVYVYYLSNKRYTLEHNLLQGNLALKIVKEM